MKWKIWFGVIILAAGLPGCITFERATYRITFDPERKLGAMEVAYRNLQSDAEAADEQKSDFRELVSAWREDDYLVDRVKEEVYVKERRLEVRDGVLVGTERSIFSNFSAVGLKQDSTGTVRWSERGMDVMRTDGTATAARDSVWWPAGTTRFELEVKNREFAPRSNFAKLFRERKQR